MELKYGMPQYLQFDMSILPHGGDLSKWEEGKESKNGWFDQSDPGTYENYPDWWYSMNFLRYKDSAYTRQLSTIHSQFYIHQMEESMRTQLTFSNKAIPWPYSCRDIRTLVVQPIAITSEKHEYLCLLEYLFYVEYMRNSSSANYSPSTINNSKPPGLYEVLNFQLYKSSNPNQVFRFIKRNTPQKYRDVSDMFRLTNSSKYEVYFYIYTKYDGEESNNLASPSLTFSLLKDWINETEGLLIKREILKDIVEKNTENENIEMKPPFLPKNKLNWTGQKKVLEFVFKELKSKGLNNTNEEIVDFLMQSFDCYKDTKRSTLLAKFAKMNDSNPPTLGKRIDLNNLE